MLTFFKNITIKIYLIILSVDLLTTKKLLQNGPWPVCPSSQRGGDGAKGMDVGYRYFGQENLVQHLSNNISI